MRFRRLKMSCLHLQRELVLLCVIMDPTRLLLRPVLLHLSLVGSIGCILYALLKLFAQTVALVVFVDLAVTIGQLMSCRLPSQHTDLFCCSSQGHSFYRAALRLKNVTGVVRKSCPLPNNTMDRVTTIATAKVVGVFTGATMAHGK